MSDFSLHMRRTIPCFRVDDGIPAASDRQFAFVIVLHTAEYARLTSSGPYFRSSLRTMKCLERRPENDR